MSATPAAGHAIASTPSGAATHSDLVHDRHASATNRVPGHLWESAARTAAWVHA